MGVACLRGVDAYDANCHGRGIALEQDIHRPGPLTDFPADTPHGSPAYRRMMRAHANCVEVLPIYTAIVVVATAVGVDTLRLDVLAEVLIGARVLQTLTHVSFTETNATVALRFIFFFAQIICMVWMGVIVATYAA